MSAHPELDALGAAIQTAMTTGEGSVEDDALVTGWVVVLEVSHGDGTMRFATLHSDYMPTWRRRGLLLEGVECIELPPVDDDL